MKLHFYRDRYLHNMEKLLNWFPDVETTFLFKKVVAHPLLLNGLPQDKVITTKHGYSYECLSADRYTTVDILDVRDGMSVFGCFDVKDKDIAVVNMFCCTESIPNQEQVEYACKYLKDVGFKEVSIGGSLILSYKPNGFDYIRVFDALATGFSSITGKRYEGLELPFELEVETYSGYNSTTILPYGFTHIGGFLDCKPICVNTEVTVLPIGGCGTVKLIPDYYTLIKLAHNGMLDYVAVHE